MKRFLVAAMVAAMVVPALVIGQVANEGLANSIVAARQKNAALLAQYNWNSRTELVVKGKTEDIRIDLVNIGPDGTTQRSLINDMPGKLPGGFLRKAVEENQRKKDEKFIKGLSNLLDQYTLPNAGKVIGFLVQAQVTPTTDATGQTILQVTGANVVVPGDTFTLSVNGTTLQATRVQFSTTYEGDQVTVDASFHMGPTGLNHLQFATISVPGKEIVVQVHNYDYVPMN